MSSAADGFLVRSRERTAWFMALNCSSCSCSRIHFCNVGSDRWSGPRLAANCVICSVRSCSFRLSLAAKV